MAKISFGQKNTHVVDWKFYLHLHTILKYDEMRQLFNKLSPVFKCKTENQHLCWLFQYNCEYFSWYGKKISQKVWKTLISLLPEFIQLIKKNTETKTS